MSDKLFGKKGYIGNLEIKNRKKSYFKSKIKEKLYKNESSMETRLYKELESLL